MDVGWLPVVWVTLGVVVVACGSLARRHPTAYATGIVAVSALWVIGGAAANAWFIARGETYSGFADGAWSAYVHDTWESLVVPHHGLFIGMLIAFEAAAGLLVLVPGRVRRWTLGTLVAFNVALLAFGWGYLVWSVPVATALVLLLRSSPPARHGSSR